MFHKSSFSPIAKVFTTVKLPDRTKKLVNHEEHTNKTSFKKNINWNETFNLKGKDTFGLTGKPIKIAYDGVQGLMAIATDNSKLHVYGQRQIDFVFSLKKNTIIKYMAFVMNKFIFLVDSLNRLITLSLESKELYKMRVQPFSITCIETDPVVPWVLLGLTDGTILVYDVVEDRISNYMINNWQKLANFEDSNENSEVVCIKWNPKDLGTVLISYKKLTVLYSLTEQSVKQTFVYQIPQNMPGSNSSSNSKRVRRRPFVIQSLFHPSSHFVLTIHDDNSLVFWDVNTGKLIQARTLFDEDINVPRSPQQQSTTQEHASPNLKALWVCQSKPEYTTLFISNSSSYPDINIQSIIMINFGRTPFYSLTSYESISHYFSRTTQQTLLPIQSQSSIKDLVSIATETPFYAGNHNPEMILVLFQNGEIEALSYPKAHFVNEGSLFPYGISWIWPQTTIVKAVDIDENTWQNLSSVTTQSLGILEGGHLVSSSNSSRRQTDDYTLLITGHSNGIVRIWNTNSSQHDCKTLFEMNTSRILNIGIKTAIKHISFSPKNLKMAAATENGDIVFYRFEANQYYSGQKLTMDQAMITKFRRFSLSAVDSFLVDVRERASPRKKYGFMPQFAIHTRHGPVTSLYLSSLNILVVAYHDGYLVVINLITETIIYNKNINDIFLSQSNYVSSINISIMAYADEDYLSTLLICGTDLGQMMIFKIVPDDANELKVTFMKTTSMLVHNKIEDIQTFVDENSNSHKDEPTTELRKCNTKGKIILISCREICIVSPGKERKQLFTKYFNNSIISGQFCSNMPIPLKKNNSFFITLSSNKEIRIFSLPDFSQVSKLALPEYISQVLSGCTTENGNILIKDDTYHSVLFSFFSNGRDSSKIGMNNMVLYNPDHEHFSRPQVNSLQWMRGTHHVTLNELNKVFSADLYHDYYNPRLLKKFEEANYKLGNHMVQDVKTTTMPVQIPRSKSLFRTASKKVGHKFEEKLDGVLTPVEDKFNTGIKNTRRNVFKTAF